MWFKQLQLFQLKNPIDLTTNHLMEKLAVFAFRPCLPSMERSQGWVTPLDTDDENAPLTRSINGYIMICLQFEEKILPASVIRQELANKIKKIRHEEDRRVGQKEKLSLKDELTMTLLPRAFSKFTKLYAYIDVNRKQLILGSTNAKKTEQFIMMFKKSISENISSLDINKLSPIITHWLKTESYPSVFGIEKSCLLQDPNQQNRIIRCQQQNLFTLSIQSLIKDGCEVKQLAMNWQDRVSFVLAHDFTLKGLRFQDDIIAETREMEPETKEQKFDADFLIMSATLTPLLNDLIDVFSQKKLDEINDKGKTESNIKIPLSKTA